MIAQPSPCVKMCDLSKCSTMSIYSKGQQPQARGSLTGGKLAKCLQESFVETLIADEQDCGFNSDVDVLMGKAAFLILALRLILAH